MLRIVLITLVVLNVCGLAFWWAEPEVTSAAPETSAYSVLPAAAQPGPTTEARVTVASSAPARGALPEPPTEPTPAAATALPTIAPATPLAGQPAPAEAAVLALPTIAPAIPLAAEPAPAEAAPAALPVAAVPSALPATSSQFPLGNDPLDARKSHQRQRQGFDIDAGIEIFLCWEGDYASAFRCCRL